MAKVARAFVVTLLIAAWSAVAAPDAAQAQTVDCTGVAQWSAGTVYFPGDRVVFQGSLYQSSATIHTVTPEAWVVSGWGVRLGSCGGNPPPPPPPPPPTDPVLILGSWTAGTSHAAPAGSNRLLVFTVHVEHEGSIAANQVTYGGQPMAVGVQRQATSGGFSAYTAIFVLGEAGIARAMNSNFVVTFSATPFRTPAFSSVFLANVDQASPLGATASNAAVSGATLSTAPLTSRNGDLAILAATNGNTGSYNVSNGFTERLELTIPSADGVAGSLETFGASATPSVTHSAPSRQSIVAAVVQAGTSQPPPPLPAPTNLQATAVSDSQVNLSWVDGFAGEDGFRIERAVGTGAFSLRATVGANVTTFQDMNLAANTTFSYRVRRFAGTRESVPSNTASATTGGGPPGQGCPVWSPRLSYTTGQIVLLKTSFFRAAVDQGPGVSGTPTDSSFFWDQVPSCPGGYPQAPGGAGLEGVLTQQQFDLMFPARDPFYTYQGLLAASRVAGLTGFGQGGTVAVRRREVAAALANFSHETGGLFFVREIARPVLCDAPSSAQWPCAPGQSYFGRGPIQLSWNFNYGPAGQFLGLNLLANPDLVATNASVSWQSALWYWVTQSGPGDRPAHRCVVEDQGFGCTIRSINGALECNGGNPAQVQSRIDSFESFKLILGATSVGPDGC